MEDDNQNTNAAGAEKESGRGRCYGDEVDNDDANSNMARSEVLILPPISDDENEVSFLARCVIR